MKLSQKKTTQLYDAISNPIIDLRITIDQSKNVLNNKNISDIDDKLFRLQRNIWKEISKIFDGV